MSARIGEWQTPGVDRAFAGTRTGRTDFGGRFEENGHCSGAGAAVVPTKLWNDVRGVAARTAIVARVYGNSARRGAGRCDFGKWIRIAQRISIGVRENVWSGAGSGEKECELF